MSKNCIANRSTSRDHKLNCINSRKSIGGVQSDFHWNQDPNFTNRVKESEPTWLTGCFLFPCNSDSLTLQGSAIVLSALSPAWQTLNMPYPSITLNLLQPPYVESIEPSLKYS